jgi:hypothetical protein
MREASPYHYDPDTARKLFRECLARTRDSMERHAQAAMAEAHDDLKRAAPLFAQRLQSDDAFNTDMQILQGLERDFWPPDTNSQTSRSRSQTNRRNGHGKQH